jgi:hypothetical protein
MAYEGPQIKIPGLTASADLSAKQYLFVKMSGETTVTVCAAATDKPIGVLQNTPTSGQEAEVAVSGLTKIIGTADLNFGDSIGTSSGGHAVAKSAGTVDYIVGQVILGNGGAGGYVTAYIDCAAAAKLGA